MLISVLPTEPGVTQAAPIATGDTKLLFTLPLGEAGVGFSPGGSEQQALGPAAMAVDGETIWIADTVLNRLVGYSRSGERTDAINLAGQVVGIGDLDVRDGVIAVLDYSGERVLRMDRVGTILDAVDLPIAYGLEAGLSGIAIAPDGGLLVELRGGTTTARLEDITKGPAALIVGRPAETGRFVVAERADPAKTRSSARVTLDTASVEIRVTHRLGGVYFAGERAGSFDVIVDEASQEAGGTVRVDRTVRRFDRSGKMTAVGRVPLSERAAYVANGIVSLPSGEVLALMPRTDRVDVVTITMRASVPSILPEGFVEVDPAPQAMASELSIASCRDRRMMDYVRAEYTALRTTLNDANKNGVCAGRMKPRSLGITPFPGVTYDWGGWETVAVWSTKMSNEGVSCVNRSSVA